PGDRQHTLERIVKVVSAEDPATLDRLEAVYGPVIEAGLHRAPSIKVAEAAKVIENTQRDLNIALMNELSLIFDRLGIRTKDVLDLRKSRVPDVTTELSSDGIAPLVHDPLASPEQARHEYGIGLSDLSALRELDAVVLAVPHRAYLDNGFDVVHCVRPGGIVV